MGRTSSIILSWLATPEGYMGTVPTIEVVFEHGCISGIGGPTTTRISRNPRKSSQLGQLAQKPRCFYVSRSRGSPSPRKRFKSKSSEKTKTS